MATILGIHLILLGVGAVIIIPLPFWYTSVTT